jgi:hypothetical protein
VNVADACERGMHVIVVAKYDDRAGDGGGPNPQDMDEYFSNFLQGSFYLHFSIWKCDWDENKPP